MTTARATLVLKALTGVLSALFVLSAAVAAYLYVLYQGLPTLEVVPGGDAVPQTSLVYAADGSVIAEWHGEQDRTAVRIDDIPQHVRDAFVAAEDRRFYDHHGVDMGAIVGSLRRGSSEPVQGGSTITQQIVKLMLSEGERTYVERLREALLAYQLEARTDKEKVLETYVNLVYFGHGWYGVEAAAQNYFGVSAGELDVAQAALLAAVVRSPGRYSPLLDPEAALARRNLVLSHMEEGGFITPSEASAARASDVVLAPPREVPEVAPHFVEYVKQDLIERLGVEAVFQGGLRVYTTLDTRMQGEAERVARAVLPGEGDPEVALVCLDHRTGEVLAMVGGRDFEANQFNLAVQGRRQPGSAFKPFVLVAALEAGVSPDARYSTAPFSTEVEDGVWEVENYEGGFPRGTLTLWDATAHSVNAVFARLIIEVGAEAVVDAAGRMGISSPLEANPAIALGGLGEGVSPLEMASAYGTVASSGLRTEPTGIERVTDAAGDTLFTVAPVAERAVAEDVAVQTSLMLHEVVERGTGTRAKLDEWAAGKTGTTQEYRDAWFVGYSGDLVAAVWVGYAEGQVEMVDVGGIRVSGGSFPATIWRDFMKKALSYRAGGVSIPAPAEDGESGTVLVEVCRDTLKLALETCPNTVQIYLREDQLPEGTCPIH
jgi:penicillin-binding protein 1A